ncbi:MAG: transglycosylase domain-containing protein [Novosphingobium sp.]|nr:transglycosylase domain-containing protein [Novosphingobium sp.]
MVSDASSDDGSSAGGDLHYRIRRDARGLLGWARGNWRERRWFRVLAWGALGLIVLYGLLWATVIRTLPSAEKLLHYQPPLPGMVRGGDGEIVYSYARERRVQLRFADFPTPLINAFLSAEDKTFWTHGGVDYTGLAGAAMDYVAKIGSGRRARGGSTITQQVAKNILIGDEYSITRKLKEMIVARKIEGTLSKEQILELYLNEIPLGRQSFGVQAAARAYFGKDVGELNLQEAAFLAVLPKAPERYGRAQNAPLAIERRNWVLDSMVRNGWATQAQADAAKAAPLGIIARRVDSYDPAVGYFVEEVRRTLIKQYGEKADDGPNSVYAGGLWVRTSLDPQFQKATQDALRAGLLRYAAGRPWHGPIAHIDLDRDRWRSQLVLENKTISYKNWRVGLLLDRSGSTGTIGFPDGETARLTGIPEKARAGDVLAAEPVSPSSWAVRNIPEVSGGMVFQQPGTGRVIAMQGGFDSGLESFNRATQAMRQPGSTIKPFVYATGLDSGMTPASMVLDGTFCVYQGARLGQKCFRNFGGGGGGTHTMRWGLEQSRNLMTVRIANDSGMDRVTRTFANVGIGNYKNFLSYALGAGDTTVLQMVNAYAALANNGVQYSPSLIDYVQDRNGKVIWRADNRPCTGCDMAKWDGKPMPRLAPRGKQVMDPGTAYQVVHMLEGVVTRGTATSLRDLDLPLFGKTGTTTGPTNVWFCGGSQDYVAGVYLGYDQPRSLGGYAQGGRIAAPIFKQVVQETYPRWSKQPFVAPEGIRMVRVDRVTGKRVYGVDPGRDPKASVIWEAFRPDTEPPRATKADELIAQRDALIAEIRQGQAARKQRQEAARQATEVRNFAEERGGVY